MEQPRIIKTISLFSISHTSQTITLNTPFEMPKLDSYEGEL